ncbi:nitrogen fixation protein NifQ [Burkholderia sp. L27(2015)]|uniref:nitrogen fixation protein NifQ n=1 Tax=Burkholderia sp. L27(2015) TaxID=1641858 RepID=UPI00131E9371|nr:nitrogen fixation protein NifQ [Burkholderia sp. L27(2015)]
MAGATDAHAPDAVLFAKLIAAREARDELPLLGMTNDDLSALCKRHFMRARAPIAVIGRRNAPLPRLSQLPATQRVVIQAVEQMDFVTKLRELLLTHIGASVREEDAACLASIIAHACLRPDHLWRDLGLNGREDVTEMLVRYFPALVARNVDQLRWKKFLARELALSLGLEPGPAPGCPGCEDFRHCFPRV